MEILDSPFFELSPIAMWLEDYSDIKKQFDIWREQGVQDLFSFFSVHDKFHRTLILSGFCLLKIAKISLNSSFFPKPIKR